MHTNLVFKTQKMEEKLFQRRQKQNFLPDSAQDALDLGELVIISGPMGRIWLPKVDN